MQSIFSKKLNKNVELETYKTEDGLNVVTATSLKRVFEEIKIERGIKEEINWDIRFDSNNEFYYAYANYKLRDKDGYESMFVGESSPATCITDIAKKYPGQMAVNRAVAEGMIAYLQLDINGKAFADIQVSDRKLVDAAIAVPSMTPQLNEDMAIPAETPATERVDEPVINDNPSASSVPAESNDVHNAAPAPATIAEPTSNAASMLTTEATAEIEMPTSTENVTCAAIDDNTIIGFGPYTNKTISQLFENAKSDARAQRTIAVAKKNVGIPTKDVAVFAYIADKAARLGL